MIIPKLTKRTDCDILVYDEVGSSWISNCIPSNASWQLLDIRHQRPIFFDYQFVADFTKQYFKFVDRSPHHRYSSYISSLFRHIDPKIILTFADNNVVLGPYASAHKSTLVVSIQNAIRGTVDSIPPDTVLPIYYSLGKAEKEVFKEINVSYQEYIPVGSAKLGIFLQNHYKQDIRWDLSFCSHFRPELIAYNASGLFKLIREAQEHLFTLTCKYARSNGLSIAVLSKTRSPILQAQEEQYFADLADGYPFFLVLGDKADYEFETYQAAMNSRLIINLCSTLGYEAFGIGKKVLFGSGYRMDLLEDWGATQYYDMLPPLTCVQDDSLRGFSSRATALLALDDDNYKAVTHRAADYYMAMPENEYPHEVIRRRLENYLINQQATDSNSAFNNQ